MVNITDNDHLKIKVNWLLFNRHSRNQFDLCLHYLLGMDDICIDKHVFLYDAVSSKFLVAFDEALTNREVDFIKYTCKSTVLEKKLL